MPSLEGHLEVYPSPAPVKIEQGRSWLRTTWYKNPKIQYSEDTLLNLTTIFNFITINGTSQIIVL